MSNKVTGANVGGASRLPIRALQASRTAQFCHSINNMMAYRIFLVMLIASLQACAPAAKNTVPRKVQAASTNSPRLTAPAALALADAFVKKGDDDLQHYPGRKAEYSADKDEWIIYYWREPNRGPGDHFMVYVHDKTRIVRVVGGA